MKYAELLNESFAEVSSSTVISGEVIERALQLKQPSIESIRDEFDVDALSDKDQRLLGFRTLGGISVRAALVSDALMQQGVISESLFDITEDDRSEVLQGLHSESARRTTEVLEASRLEAEDVLTLGSFVNSLTDPLDKIPHSFVREQLFRHKRAQTSAMERLTHLVSYINVIPGAFPPTGFRSRAIGVNDSLLIQAFGRNSVPDKELSTIRDKNIHAESDFEMFAYLDHIGFDPGDSNRALADVIDEQLNREEVIEPIGQWEPMYALWQKNSEKYRQYQNYFHLLWPHSNFYPTYEVKADSIAIMDQLGMYNPLELAHQDMIVRALAILARFGVDADALVGDIPFDPSSVQAQTRGKGPWVVRETLTRVEHILRNRVRF